LGYISPPFRNTIPVLILLNSPGSTNVFTAMMNPWIHITSTGGGIACDPGTAWHVQLAIVHPQSVLVQRGFAIANPC